MSSSPITLLFTILALILVLALAWVFIRALSRFSPGTSRNGRIQILQNVPLGPRERLILVRLDDSEYFLGVTSGGISVLQNQPFKAVDHSNQIDENRSNPA